jgi:hypothetical protein
MQNAYAQAVPLRIHSNIQLPKDTIDRKTLLASLNDFLAVVEKPNEENTFVLENEKLETFVELDELKDITKGKQYNDDYFYKPYLTNVVSQGNHQYLIQVSFIGTSGEESFLRASFEFIAHRSNDVFLFSSPLKANTKYWKTQKIGSCTFHYQATLNEAKAKSYCDIASGYDAKLHSLNRHTEFYCCDNVVELARLVGVDYKSDYYGRTKSVWSTLQGNKNLVVLGNDNGSFDNFDPHDTWHERLSFVTPRNKVNHAVDEGCAYLYGGSWGLSWKEIFKAFKEQLVTGNATNWLQAKEQPLYFKTKDINNAADYIVNALLVKKIEKEHGFAGVWEMLNSGPADKDNTQYFATLEKLTGISKADYNARVQELISRE